MDGTGTTQSTAGAASDDAAATGQLVDVLQQHAGPLTIGRFLEESCLSSDVSHPETKTRWNAVLKSPKGSTSSTDDVFTRIDALAETNGMEAKGGRQDPREAFYQKGDIAVLATRQSGAGTTSVEIVIAGPCRDQPEGHLMRKDPQDPSFGAPEPHYDRPSSSSPTP